MENNIAVDLIPLLADIDTLHELPGNPRQGNVEAVALSYERFGQRKPIVARRDGTVIAGNHQLKAAKQLGWSKIAVVWVDDDDETASAFALADNRTADLGSYDEDLLAELLSRVEDLDLLAATGYTQEDIDKLLGTNGGTALLDPDYVPAPPSPTTKAGDVWLLGSHRLMCGDATLVADVDHLMKGETADIVWTDPPYGVSYVGKTKDALTISNDQDGSVLAGAFDSVLRVARPGAAVYVAAPSGPAGLVFAVELASRGLFRQKLVWVKNAIVLGHSDYHYQHEDIYFGYTPGEGRKGRGGPKWYGDNAQSSVLKHDKPSRSAEHPTMKPVSLIEQCLGNNATSGELVLDLFGGSGSTLVAAIELGMRAFLMELDPAYVDVICKRFQIASGELPVREATGESHDFVNE